MPRSEIVACCLRAMATLSVAFMTSSSAAENHWLELNGAEGPGVGKKVVLISGDEEYRSEEALPQLARILAKHYGFQCSVHFAIDPHSGLVDPNTRTHIPGLQLLEDADLMVIATRYRDLPREQMRRIDDYLMLGRPVIGLRTATHAFAPPPGSDFAHYSCTYDGEKVEWHGGFGKLVLGETWVAHHGRHKHEGTRGVIPEAAKGHPVLRGISTGEVWGATDVYTVRLPIPAGARVLLRGQVTQRQSAFDEADRWFGMRPNDPALDSDKNRPMMPVAWLKTYQLPEGREGRAFVTTMGASTDFENEGLRKLFTNAALYLTGLEVPHEGAVAEKVGEYQPSQFGFHEVDYFLKKKLSPADM